VRRARSPGLGADQALKVAEAAGNRGIPGCMLTGGLRNDPEARRFLKNGFHIISATVLPGRESSKKLEGRLADIVVECEPAKTAGPPLAEPFLPTPGKTVSLC